MAVDLPPESYDPRALQDIEDTVAAARRIIEDQKNATNSGQKPNSGLADLALQAGEIAQQQKDKEATKEALQAKIQTMAEQVFSGHNDSPEKDQNIANFSNQFRVEPKDDNPDELGIYYYGQDGTRASELYIMNFYITGELSIPSELQIAVLNCGGNQLTALPELPTGLTGLICSHNKLTALPKLPAGLTELECRFNKLTALPELPTGLTGLECYGNQLTALPELPAGLTGLWCGFNQLTSLPELPAGLTWLRYGGNPLSETTKKYIESRGFSWQ